MTDFLLLTSYFLLLTSDFLPLTAYLLLLTSYCLTLLPSYCLTVCFPPLNNRENPLTQPFFFIILPGLTYAGKLIKYETSTSFYISSIDDRFLFRKAECTGQY